MNLGFTVLELLLAITVIMLLTSLSLQSYANAQRQARIAACKVYRKQVETFHEMPEYNLPTISDSDIKVLVKTYDQCYQCHTTARIPYYYAE
jgi:Tfp pilus assembly protein PilE|tara:strand:+ start:141 stop:416 length:276 start_codon:yes stop_codon:yes gene_type:complete